MDVLQWIVDFFAKYWWVIILIIVVGLFLRGRFNGDDDDRGEPPDSGCPA